MSTDFTITNFVLSSILYIGRIEASKICYNIADSELMKTLKRRGKVPEVLRLRERTAWISSDSGQ